MSTYNIAVLPGDGIGPEVTKEAVKVLKALERLDSSISFTFTEFPWNSEYYLQHQQMMPEDGLEQLQSFDSILFGAIGDARVPDQISIWQLIMPIRKQFQQFVNFRPVKRLKGIESPLKNDKPIDFVIIRENGERKYSNIGGSMFAGEDREMAVQNTIMTRKGVTQIAEFAYQYARENNYTKVTNATKIQCDYSYDDLLGPHRRRGEQRTRTLITNGIISMRLPPIFCPAAEDFQVVLASNLFGDILSDLGSAIVGGLGFAPSGNINPTREYPSMFEAVHGSAPDIAGKKYRQPDCANLVCRINAGTFWPPRLI